MRTSVVSAVSIGLALVMPAAGAFAAPSIDGAISPSNEWDGCYLGTSAVGEMVVDVYGVVEGDWVYVAYVADESTGGWGAAQFFGPDATFQFRTPQDAVWPAAGFTSVAPTASSSSQVAQTDGGGWVNVGSMADVGAVCEYIPVGFNVSGDEVVEMALPLDLLTYAGADGMLELSGHYWQAQMADPVYLELPVVKKDEPDLPVEVEIDVKPGNDRNHINFRSRGVVPVAILTTDEFDAASVAPELTIFAGALARRWATCDVDGDGDNDLKLRFRVRKLELEVGDTEAHLAGWTVNGDEIHGCDAVKVKKPKKGK